MKTYYYCDIAILENGDALTFNPHMSNQYIEKLDFEYQGMASILSTHNQISENKWRSMLNH